MNLALELRDGADHVEHQPAHRRRGVDRRIEDHQAGTLGGDAALEPDRMLEAARKSVELRDNQLVARPQAEAASFVVLDRQWLGLARPAQRLKVG